MLLQFIVENFKSFDKEVVLNMIPSQYSDHAHHIYTLEGGKKVDALRSSALFGANASGKTNLFKAIQYSKQLITEGTRGEQKLDHQPFKLRKSSAQSPTRFEYVFKYDGIIYHYGFLLNHSKILEEWLFARPKGQEVKYFERITDKNNKVKLELGNTFAPPKSKSRKVLDLVKETTRPNQLFLKEAYEKNIEKLKPAYQWFASILHVIPAISEYGPLELRAFSDEDFTGFLSNFLRNTDTGIDSIETESTNLNLEEHFTDLPVNIREDMRQSVNDGNAVVFNYTDHRKYAIIKNDEGNIVAISLKTRHKMIDDDETVAFEIFEESEGTRRLLNILPALVDMKNEQAVYVIDELDRRMHTKLTRYFLSYFLNHCTSQPNQLIFTTHDSNLLDEDLLRRDEIWFLEKNKHGESDLYSLTEFKPRNDLKLNKGYLQGRFGGIPYIKSALTE